MQTNIFENKKNCNVIKKKENTDKFQQMTNFWMQQMKLMCEIEWHKLWKCNAYIRVMSHMENTDISSIKTKIQNKIDIWSERPKIWIGHAYIYMSHAHAHTHTHTHTHIHTSISTSMPKTISMCLSMYSCIYFWENASSFCRSRCYTYI